MSAAQSKKEIAEVINTFFRSLEEQRYDRIEALFHQDGSMWDVFLPHLVRGPAERAELWDKDQKQFTSRGKFSWSVDGPHIDLWGDDTAVANYYLNFAFQPPNPASAYCRMVDVMRRVDGRWLIVHHCEAPTPGGARPSFNKS
jgi:hypothetical protein